MLEPQERRILALKYASKHFASLSETEIRLYATKLLITISLITGWSLPEEDTHLQILIDQLSLKLKEGYSNLNVDEIEYSFRNYPVKDWGKNLNLNLIDEVMEGYREKRSEVSRMEESKAAPVEQTIYSEDDIKNFRRIEINEAFKNIKKGYKPLVHKYFEEVLKEDELLREGESFADFVIRRFQSENIYIKQ